MVLPSKHSSPHNYGFVALIPRDITNVIVKLRDLVFFTEARTPQWTTFFRLSRCM